MLYNVNYLHTESIIITIATTPTTTTTTTTATSTTTTTAAATQPLLLRKQKRPTPNPKTQKTNKTAKIESQNSGQNHQDKLQNKKLEIFLIKLFEELLKGPLMIELGMLLQQTL